MELARDLEIGDKVYHIENKLKGIVTHRDDDDDERLVEWEDGNSNWYMIDGRFWGHDSQPRIILMHD